MFKIENGIVDFSFLALFTNILEGFGFEFRLVSSYLQKRLRVKYAALSLENKLYS